MRLGRSRDSARLSMRSWHRRWLLYTDIRQHRRGDQRHRTRRRFRRQPAQTAPAGPGELVSVILMAAVFESALSTRLKPAALAYASFADHDGRNCCPSLRRIAWMLSIRDPRHVRRLSADLRAIGVLLDEGESQFRTRLYRFIAEALPQRPAFEPWSIGPPGLQTLQVYTPLGPGSPDSATLVHTPPDPSLTRQILGTEKAPPPSRRFAHHPVGISEGTFALYTVIAREARRRSNEEDGSDSLANILEIFKTLCAQRHLAYDGELADRVVQAIVHVVRGVA